MWLLFFRKKKTTGTTGNGNLRQIEKMFSDFFGKVESYEIQSDDKKIQFLEIMVGQGLKILEEVVQFPDIKWALDNKVFNNIDLKKINNVITPYVDCLKTKLNEFRNDQELYSLFEEKKTGDTFDTTSPVFMNELSNRLPLMLFDCFKGNFSEEHYDVIKETIITAALNNEGVAPDTAQMADTFPPYSEFDKLTLQNFNFY